MIWSSQKSSFNALASFYDNVKTWESKRLNHMLKRKQISAIITLFTTKWWRLWYCKYWEKLQKIFKILIYAVMGDKATNASQPVICMRWVDDDLVAHDEFIRLKDMPCTNVESMVKKIKDVFLCMNLKINKCCGQCYDGYSTMSSHKNEVVAQIKEEEKWVPYNFIHTALHIPLIGQLMILWKTLIF